MLSDHVITADCMTLVYLINRRNPSVKTYGPMVYQDEGLGAFKVSLYQADYNPVLYMPFVYKNLPVQLV